MVPTMACARDCVMVAECGTMNVAAGRKGPWRGVSGVRRHVSQERMRRELLMKWRVQGSIVHLVVQSRVSVFRASFTVCSSWPGDDSPWRGSGSGDCWSKTAAGGRTDQGGAPAAAVAAAARGLPVVRCVAWTRDSGARKVWDHAGRPGGLARDKTEHGSFEGASSVRGVGVGLRHLHNLLFREAACLANVGPRPDVQVRGLRREAVSTLHGRRQRVVSTNPRERPLVLSCLGLSCIELVSVGTTTLGSFKQRASCRLFSSQSQHQRAR